MRSRGSQSAVCPLALVRALRSYSRRSVEVNIAVGCPTSHQLLYGQRGEGESCGLS